MIKKLLFDENAQTMVEYAFVTFVLVLGIVASVKILEQLLSNTMENTRNCLDYKGYLK